MAFAYGGSQAASFANGVWQVAAASVTGPSHVKRGVGCDDAAAAASTGSSLFAVVCDGAGSSQFGGRGAETAARLSIERLASAARDEASLAPNLAAVRDALHEVRAALLADAAREGVKPSAFATTIVGAWLGEADGLLFHLGDGVGLAFAANNDVLAVSRGRLSEYANETYFLTDETWEESLAFEPLPDGTESLFLMTDGVTPFAMELNTPKASFYEGVLAYLRRNRAGKGAAAIQRLLDKEEARAKVSDDKTLLWVHRAISPRETPDGTAESATELAR